MACSCTLSSTRVGSTTPVMVVPAMPPAHGQARAGAPAAGTAVGGAPAQGTDGGLLGGLNDVLFGTTGPRGAKHDGLVQTMAKTAARTVGSSLGKEILRGVMGSLFGGSGKRR